MPRAPVVNAKALDYTMETHIKAFRPPHTKLGECPLYRDEDGTLHYIDVLGYCIHILPLAAPNLARVIRCPELISFMCFCQGGGYLVCYFQGIAKVGENGEWEVLKKIIPDEQKGSRRLNDGAVDSQGRLWFGSVDMYGFLLLLLSISRTRLIVL
jgi:sugar lactone lactonase YvrE